MAEPFTDDLRVDAGGECERRMRVPKIVQTYPRLAAVPDLLVEHLREAIWVDGRAVFPAEDEALVLVRLAQFQLLLVLRRSVSL